MKWKFYQFCCVVVALFCIARLLLGFYEQFVGWRSLNAGIMVAYTCLFMTMLKSIWAFRLSMAYLDVDRLQSKVNGFFYVLFAFHAFLEIIQLVYLWQLIVSKAGFGLRTETAYRVLFYANFFFIGSSFYTLLFDLPLALNIRKKAKRSLILSIAEE